MQQEPISLSAEQDWDQITGSWESIEAQGRLLNPSQCYDMKFFTSCFQGKQTFEVSESLQSMFTIYVWCSSINLATQLYVFRFHTAELQIIVLFEHDVLFTEWILWLPFIPTRQISVQLASELTSSVLGIHLDLNFSHWALRNYSAHPHTHTEPKFFRCHQRFKVQQ